MAKVSPTTGDSSWFVNDRFGLFIHWGIYALPARHEWVKQREEIPDAVYKKYFKHFDPDLYDPTLWAKAAAGAGMKYFVITTKHHDGFCLWDTQQTDYKVTNTPWGQDLIAPMVEAFRAEGLKVGFYHSVIDWHHPQYDYVKANRLPYPLKGKPSPNGPRNHDIYVDYLHHQVRELFTNYGKIDVIWWDYSKEGNDGPFWRSRESCVESVAASARKGSSSAISPEGIDEFLHLRYDRPKPRIVCRRTRLAEIFLHVDYQKCRFLWLTWFPQATQSLKFLFPVHVINPFSWFMELEIVKQCSYRKIGDWIKNFQWFGLAEIYGPGTSAMFMQHIRMSSRRQQRLCRR
jgi:hypothetical protein